MICSIGEVTFLGFQDAKDDTKFATPTLFADIKA